MRSRAIAVTATAILGLSALTACGNDEPAPGPTATTARPTTTKPTPAPKPTTAVPSATPTSATTSSTGTSVGAG